MDLNQYRLSPSFMVFITVVFVLVMIDFWQKRRRIAVIGNKIPGPTQFPLLGNAHILIGKSHNQIMDLALSLSKTYGETVRGWLGPKLVIFISNPSDIELILSSPVHLEKSDDYRFFQPWLGNGLLISNGDHWRSHRKMIAPAFHRNVLKTFTGTFYHKSCMLLERLNKEVGNVFDVHDYMSEATVDILLETAMGSKLSFQNKKAFDYANAVMKMCDIIHKRTYHFMYRWDPFYNQTGLRKMEEKFLDIIHGLTKQVIKLKHKLYDSTYKDGAAPSPSLQEIINYREEYDSHSAEKLPIEKGLRDDLDDIDENDIGEKRRLAFLDLLIETSRSGANLTDDEIKDEVNTIMFEGHDTTAAASSFVLCLLGIYKDIQEKVYQEVHRIFGDSPRVCTFADTMQMKYLERVILETLRKYPPVPIIARKLNEDVILASDSNHVMPKDSTVVLATFLVHRREDSYKNPDIFDPDNFLPERTQNRHYYSFIPFSAGPRSCVGRKYAMLKLKVLLSTIIRNFTIHSPDGEDEFKLQADIILKRTDGFRIQIEPRVTADI